MAASDSSKPGLSGELDNVLPFSSASLLTLEYYCNTCDVAFQFRSKLERHCLTQSHKRFEKLLKCAPETTTTSLPPQV